MLEIKNLMLSLGHQTLISDLTLSIAAGQLVTVMGPSGAGKSTLLHWISGVLEPCFIARGQLWLNGVRCDHLPIEKRRIGILFQDSVLFPHLNVGSNLAFALPSSLSKTERRHRVKDVLARIGLDDFYDRDPATLSGGQAARIACMRTLLAEPEALVLDEPFAHLDAETAQSYRQFVFQHIAEYAIPALLVTHNPDDVPPHSTLFHLGSLCDTVSPSFFSKREKNV